MIEADKSSLQSFLKNKGVDAAGAAVPATPLPTPMQEVTTGLQGANNALGEINQLLANVNGIVNSDLAKMLFRGADRKEQRIAASAGQEPPPQRALPAPMAEAPANMVHPPPPPPPAENLSVREQRAELAFNFTCAFLKAVAEKHPEVTLPQVIEKLEADPVAKDTFVRQLGAIL